MNYDTAQLIVPLMDFIVRWSMFKNDPKQEAREFFKNAGLENGERFAVDAFLDALDATARELEAEDADTDVA